MSYRRREAHGVSLADWLSKTERLAVSSIRFVDGIVISQTIMGQVVETCNLVSTPLRVQAGLCATWKNLCLSPNAL